VPWYSGFILIKPVYSTLLIIILILLIFNYNICWWQWGRSVPELACWLCVPLFYWTPWGWHTGVETCRSWYLSWIVFYCILL